MKINTDWLKEYVDLPESLAKLKEDLTMFGLVVEAISDFQGTPVLEIEVTSNRPDCLSHVGVAREIAALYEKPLRLPGGRSRLRLRQERKPFTIEILAADLCPRYVGLVLDSVSVAASPAWMQKRLESAGMRPVNNVVDITNYVLLEMGHPLHAFDFELLRGGRIVVARAGEGQKIVTLDGVERLLDQEMLLINDGEGPVAVAGVMGGLNSEISLNTHTVLLECAYFKPTSVRRTSKRLGLSTESSYRFERGADWDDLVPVVARTCDLMRELAGARVAGSLRDVYPARVASVEIPLQRKRAESLLGANLTDDSVESSLQRLNFKPIRKGKGAWQVVCPSYRADMELEADLIEELARFYGYQNIPTTLPPGRTAGTPSPVFRLESSVTRMLTGLGYSEAVNLSFAAETDDQEFPAQGIERVAIRNPLTEETKYLRSTLAAGLVRSVKRNLNHDQRQVRLFEIGKVYQRGGPGERPVERNTLGIVGTGCFASYNWLHPAGEYDFFHLKGAVETLLRSLRSTQMEIVPADCSWLSPLDASHLCVGGKKVGILGELHPVLMEQYKIKQPVFLAEIDLESLAGNVFQPVQYQALPRFPAVERDLSIILDRGVTYEAVKTGISGLGIRELQSIDLVDVYQGEKIPDGKLSITIRCVFLDRERTLTVDRVQSFSDNVVTFLRSTYGAELR